MYQRLVAEAIKARNQAYAPYSGLGLERHYGWR